MMMVLCPKAGSLAFVPSGDEMSEAVSRCLPRRQSWVSNLSKVAMKWLEVYSNLRPSGCKAQNMPLHHRIPLQEYTNWQHFFCCKPLLLFVEYLNLGLIYLYV